MSASGRERISSGQRVLGVGGMRGIRASADAVADHANGRAGGCGTWQSLVVGVTVRLP